MIVNECYLYSDDTKIISTLDNKMQLEKNIVWSVIVWSAIVWSMENWLNFFFNKFKKVKDSLQKMK